MEVNKVNQSFDFDWVKQDDIKLELTGTCEQFSLLRKAPIYSKLVGSGVKVSFITDHHSVGFGRPESKLHFLSILENLVKTKKDEKISDAFAELGDEET